MIKRLRDKHSDQLLKEIYPEPHRHSKWHDHISRVNITIEIAKFFNKYNILDSIADLSCGDGHIVTHLFPVTKYLGDFAPGYEFQGPIENTLDQIPKVDLYICCETLEHLDDPLSVLQKIREKSDKLILSTPVNNWNDGNIEHYWSWDREGVEELLKQAGFTVHLYNELDFRRLGPAYYCFGIWACA